MAEGSLILADNVPANEFLNLEGQKFSTSRGWAVWAADALDAFPAMVVALATGIGLAAGTAIGSFVARRFFGLDRAAALVVRRARSSR